MPGPHNMLEMFSWYSRVAGSSVLGRFRCRRGPFAAPAVVSGAVPATSGVVIWSSRSSSRRRDPVSMPQVVSSAVLVVQCRVLKSPAMTCKYRFPLRHESVVSTWSSISSIVWLMVEGACMQIAWIVTSLWVRASTGKRPTLRPTLSTSAPHHAILTSFPNR